MRSGLCLGVAGLALLAGCQTPAQTAAQQYIFVRTDGHSLSDDPRYAQQFEIDKTVCIAEVQKAAVGAPIIYWQGLAGAISAAMIENQQQAALIDIMKGCMAGKGYVFVPKTQAAAVAASFRTSKRRP